MESAFLGVLFFFVGALLTFCTKAAYKHKVFGITSLIAMGTILPSLYNSLYYGSASQLNFDFTLLYQKFQIAIDPLSALMSAILLIPLAIFLFNAIVTKTKNKIYNPEILMLLMGVTLFTLLVQNGIYFYIGILALSILLLIYAGISDENISQLRNTSFIIYLCNSLIVLALMILGIESQGLTFSSFVKALGKDINFNNNIFILIFTSFCTLLFSSKYILNSLKLLKPSNHNLLLVINTILYVICVYGLFRFISMGAVPTLLPQCIIMTILSLLICTKIYKLYKSENLQDALSCMKTINTALLLNAMLFGIFGYVYGTAVLSILGYSAAFIFLINTIITEYFLRYNSNEFKEMSDKINDNNISAHDDCSYRKILYLGLYNYSGAPGAIGFVGWLFITGALDIGIIQQTNIIKIVSIILSVFMVIVFSALMSKTFVLIKRDLPSNNTTQKFTTPKLNFILGCFQILAGIFPQQIIRIIFVPVSFFLQ